MQGTMLLAWLLTLCIGWVSSAQSPDSHNHQHHPQQVHLALGTNESEMLVTWVTMKKLKDGGPAHCEFGPNSHHLDRVSVAEVEPFKSKFVTYRALLTGLRPNTTYYYRVGSKSTSYTEVFHFKTLPTGSNWSPRIAFYGDLGYENEQSLPYLRQDVQANMYDVIFHVGDLAYDLHDRDGEQGNDFMRSIEPVAANIPYMVIPGNHEHHKNFSHYDARFSMLGDRHDPQPGRALRDRINNHFWSVDLGPAHILMFSTEFYYYTQYGTEQIEQQYRFIEADLKRANANRKQRPWIIVMGHRPMYCLKKDEECLKETMERPELRQGVADGPDKANKMFGLENLFYQYGVDIQIYGHEHFYGRLLPVYQGVTLNGTGHGGAYDSPGAPVHIITGSAGNRENHPDFSPHLKDFVGFHATDYGYSRMTFKKNHLIHIEQISDDKGGVVIDQIDILKHDAQPRWLIK